MSQKSLNFSEYVKNQLVIGQKLLRQGSHGWAEITFEEILSSLERQKDLSTKSKEYIRSLIVQAWQARIQDLNRDQSPEKWLFLVDAYHHILFVLFQNNSFKEIAKISQSLVLSLISQKQISRETLASILDPVSEFLLKGGFRREALEIQLAMMLIRGSAKSSDTLNKLLQYLASIVLKLGLNFRPIFFYVLFDNAIDFFKLEADRSARNELVSSLIETCRNAVSLDIRDAMTQTSRFVHRFQIQEVKGDFVKLVQKLEILNEFDWAFGIIRNFAHLLIENGLIEEALNLSQEFSEFSIRRGFYQFGFQGYTLIGNALAEQGKKNELVALWYGAARMFARSQQADLLNESIKKIDEYLDPPQTFANSQPYFETYNEIWNLKSRLGQTNEVDFWKMIFFRALFEERDMNIAKLAWSSLPEAFRSKCHPTGQIEDAIANQPRPLVGKITHARLVIRLVEQQEVDIYCTSPKSEEYLEIHSPEPWNSAELEEIFSQILTRQRDLELMAFGRLIYLNLPGEVRRTIKSFKAESVQTPPHLLFIMDKFSLPVGLIHDGTSFLNLKFAVSSLIGPTSLRGTSEMTQDNLAAEKLRLLFIANINVKDPRIWDEKNQKEEPLYNLSETEEEVNQLIQFAQKYTNVESISYLIGTQATKDKILATIRELQPHILHYAGILFYVEENPGESYLLAPEGKTISLEEIFQVFEEVPVRPLLVLNVKLVNKKGDFILNAGYEAGQLGSLQSKYFLTGVLTRFAPIFNADSLALFKGFYDCLLSRKVPEVGVAVLKGGQQLVADKALQQATSMSKTLDDIETKVIHFGGDLTAASFLLFGLPWRKI